MNKVCFQKDVLKGISKSNHMLTMKATEDKQNCFLLLYCCIFLQIATAYIKVLHQVKRTFFENFQLNQYIISSRITLKMENPIVLKAYSIPRLLSEDHRSIPVHTCNLRSSSKRGNALVFAFKLRVQCWHVALFITFPYHLLILPRMHRAFAQNLVGKDLKLHQLCYTTGCLTAESLIRERKRKILLFTAHRGQVPKSPEVNRYGEMKNHFPHKAETDAC